MRYKKILFCVPPFTKKWRAPTAGVGYLSAFLISHGIDNDVLDMTLGYSTKDLSMKIETYKPDLIGVFLMTHKYDIAYKLVKHVKIKYGIDVVVGGPHVSTLRSKVLEGCDADFAVKLEGEYTLKELMAGEEFEKIVGLIYRSGENVVENNDREFIQDLDAIPFPTYEKHELEKYTDKVIPLITSRGCPYNCIYCPVKTAIGRHFRVRSAENVLEEIKYWYNRGYRKFDFQDDNFTFYKDRVSTICDLIEEQNLKGLILNCPNGVRADKVDRELLRKMREVGFKTIAFGVEGGNNRILRNLKKGERIEVIENAISTACELGFDVGLFFLVGSPGETPSDVEDSIKLALKYPIADAFFYNIIPYPHTQLYKWIAENRYFLKSPKEYLSRADANSDEPLFETPEFPNEERRKMLIYTKKIHRKIRKESIKRRMSKYGMSGKIGTLFLASDFAGKYILESKPFLRIYNYYLSKQAENQDPIKMRIPGGQRKTRKRLK